MRGEVFNESWMEGVDLWKEERNTFEFGWLRRSTATSFRTLTEMDEQSLRIILVMAFASRSV